MSEKTANETESSAPVPVEEPSPAKVAPAEPQVASDAAVPVAAPAESVESVSTPAPVKTRAKKTVVKKAVETKPKAITKPKSAEPVKKTASVAKPKAKSSHPSFFDMITEAIEKLGERSGSSRVAILKYIISNYKIDEKTGNQHVKLVLKNAVKAGTLKQVRGIGASGSFKLASQIEKKNNKSAKKSTTKAAPTHSTASVTAKEKTKSVAKKVVKKSPAPVKKATKKSAAKPAPKRAQLATMAITKATAISKTKTSPTNNRRAKPVREQTKPVKASVPVSKSKRAVKK